MAVSGLWLLQVVLELVVDVGLKYWFSDVCLAVEIVSCRVMVSSILDCTRD